MGSSIARIRSRARQNPNHRCTFPRLAQHEDGQLHVSPMIEIADKDVGYSLYSCAPVEYNVLIRRLFHRGMSINRRVTVSIRADSFALFHDSST